MENYLLTGSVLWSYGHEVSGRNTSYDLAYHVTGVSPFHNHKGTGALTNDKIVISGDTELSIPLSALQDICLGFDEIYTRSLVKNFGLGPFWQPLRLDLLSGERVYLIIDLGILSSSNKLWFETIKGILS